MVEKYGDTHSSAGWVWAIVGIIVAALIVWWIAAAVSNDTEPQYGGETIGALEEEGTGIGEPVENNEFAQNQLGATTADEQTDPPQVGEFGGSDPVAESDPSAIEDPLAETDPNANNDPLAMGDEESFQDAGAQGEQPSQDQPAQLQALNDWNQQQQGELTPDAINEGANRLNQAAGGVLLLFSQAPQPGAQVGGGPSGDMAESVSSQRAMLDESVKALQEAESSNQSLAFHAAAANFVSLLDEMQAQVNLQQVSEPLEQLRQGVAQIEPSQPLSDQQEQVQSFFDQGAEVLNVFAQNIQPSDSGSNQMQQPSQQQMPPAQQPMQNEQAQ